MASQRRRLMVCLRNDGYGVSVERRKIYEAHFAGELGQTPEGCEASARLR